MARAVSKQAGEQLPSAFSEVGSAIVGIGERAGLAEEGIAGGPLREPSIPVRPGLERIADFAAVSRVNSLRTGPLREKKGRPVFSLLLLNRARPSALVTHTHDT